MEKIKNFFKKNWSFILLIIIALCIRNAKLIAINIVDGQSMMPTLTDGQLSFGSSLAKYERGDIVVVKAPQKFLVKRIIGLPNEKIESKNGKIYINDVELNEDYLDSNRNINSSKEEWSVQLGENEYFVMGDNRDNSADSRYYGPFDKSYLAEKLYLY